jgi:hypothetical protein
MIIRRKRKWPLSLRLRVTVAFAIVDTKKLVKRWPAATVIVVVTWTTVAVMIVVAIVALGTASKVQPIHVCKYAVTRLDC